MPLNPPIQDENVNAEKPVINLKKMFFLPQHENTFAEALTEVNKDIENSPENPSLLLNFNKNTNPSRTLTEEWEEFTKQIDARNLPKSVRKS